MYNALEPVEGNVRLIYISNIKINLRETKIGYIIDSLYNRPILETIEWILQKYYPIPKKTDTIFSIINIPETLTLQTIYIGNQDQEYLDKYCKLGKLIPICKRTRPNTPILTSNTCEAEIIKNMFNHCERILSKIDSITYIPLTALEKYIVIPQQEPTLDKL